MAASYRCPSCNKPNDIERRQCVWCGTVYTKTLVDLNVEAVKEKLDRRSRIGMQKYGTTTDRSTLTRLQWLQHAQEEAMDLAIYLQRLITEEENG